MRLLALLAVLLPAPVATGQYSFRNLTVPAGTTAIIWNGAPALCIVVAGNNPFATFKNNYMWPAGPEVELVPQGIGFWDFRPCTVGSSTYISSYDVGTYAPLGLGTVDPSGLSVRIYPNANKSTLTYNKLNMQSTQYWVDYCGSSGLCGKCPFTASYPEGACIVATLLIR